MNLQRRNMLKLGTVLSLAVAAGVLKPEEAWAVQEEWNKAAFTATSVDDVVKAFGGDKASESDKIKLTAPDIAENGAVVPVGVSTDLPGATQISILVAKNPNALAAQFDILEDMLPEAATRIKMSETSDVYALVKADGKFYTTKKEIKVTLGGCGG